MEFDSSAVGAVLRSYRMKYNLSQKDLSRCIGVSQSSIAEIETGAVKKGNLKTYMKFADYFNISLDTLFKDVLYSLNKKETRMDIQIMDELKNFNINDLRYVDKMVSAFLKYENLNKQGEKHEANET